MFLNLLSSIFKFKYLKIYKRNLKSSSTIILEKDTCSFFQKIKRFSKLGEKTLPNPSAKKKKSVHRSHHRHISHTLNPLFWTLQGNL